MSVLQLFILFHGEEILGFIAAGALGLLATPLVAIWLWSRPPRNPLLPAALYFVVAAGANIAVQMDDSLGTALFAWLVLSPWSIVTILVSTFFEADLGKGAFLLAGILNTCLIYAIGRGGRLDPPS